MGIRVVKESADHIRGATKAALHPAGSRGTKAQWRISRKAHLEEMTMIPVHRRALIVCVLAMAGCGAVDWHNETASDGMAVVSGTYQGCYTDDASRALDSELIASGATVESCLQAAQAQGFAYCGLQYGGECWAGNAIGYAKVVDSECNMRCRANRLETCGGAWRNSLYAISTPLSLAVPGRLEAEAYKAGGDGVGYHDTTSGNLADGSCRGDDVDLKAAGAGNCIVGFFAKGEWLAYDVAIAASGSYDLTAQIACGLAGSGFHVEVDGVDVTGTVSVPATGSWTAYGAASRSDISLTAGHHTLRLVNDVDYFDLDYFELKASPPPPPPPGGYGPRGTPGPIASYPIPSGHQTVVNPGGDLAAKVNAAPANEVVLLNPGTYSTGTANLAPASGVKIVGNGLGVTVDGRGATYFIGGESTDVLLANVRVTNFNSGEGQTPSITPYLDSPSGSPGSSPSQRWTYDHLEVDHFGAAAVRIPTDGVMRNCKIHDTGSNAVTGWLTANGVLEDSLLYNVDLSHQHNWMGATAYSAIIKIFQTTGWKVRYNEMTGAEGPGIWFDTENSSVEISNNYVHDTDGPGIFYEFSYGAQIHDNLVEHTNLGNEKETGTDVYAGAILVSVSQGTASAPLDVNGNVLRNNRSGITLLQDDRTSPDLRNVFVHDNDLSQNLGSEEVAGLWNYLGDSSYWTSKNNRYSHNTYASGSRFNWLGGERDQPYWQSQVETDAVFR
jgi:hypothetical protein